MKLKLNLSKKNKSARPYVGLRIIKTVTAVFFCALAGNLHGQPVYFSMVAALICMQNTAGQTLEVSLNQVVGTIVGGVFGVGVLYFDLLTGLQSIMPLYYLFCSLLLIPVIRLTLLIKKPAVSALSCIVFLSIAVFRLGTADPWLYALQRALDTCIGVAAAFIINIILPYKTEPAEPESFNSDDFSENTGK